MGLQVCVLASGSSGNCIYVGNEDTHLLIDAGVSCKVICERLSEIGVDPAALQGICISHEHGDHHVGVAVLHRKFGIPVFGNAGTVEVLGRSTRYEGLPWNVFTTGQPFRVGSIVVEPFPIPHDSFEPVAFILRDEESRIGICTDLGIATDLVRARLKQCNLLILETNHDEELLLGSERSWSLKQRIMGAKGHLSNRKATELLCSVACERLDSVFLAHMSRDCNRPQLAEDTVREGLTRAGLEHVSLHATYPDRVSHVWRHKDLACPSAQQSTEQPARQQSLHPELDLVDVES